MSDDQHSDHEAGRKHLEHLEDLIANEVAYIAPITVSCMTGVITREQAENALQGLIGKGELSEEEAQDALHTIDAFPQMQAYLGVPDNRADIPEGFPPLLWKLLCNEISFADAKAQLQVLQGVGVFDEDEAREQLYDLETLQFLRDIFQAAEDLGIETSSETPTT